MSELASLDEFLIQILAISFRKLVARVLVGKVVIVCVTRLACLYFLFFLFKHFSFITILLIGDTQNIKASRLIY